MRKGIWAVLLAIALQLTVWTSLAMGADVTVEVVKEPVPGGTENAERISSEQALEIFYAAFPEITGDRNLVAELDEYAGNSLWRIYEADPILIGKRAAIIMATEYLDAI